MLKQLVLVLSMITFFGTFALAQEKPETENKEKQECMKESHGCCSSHQMHSEMKMEENNESANDQAWNKVCPVKGNEVDIEVVTIEYNGKQYGFCCEGCESKFSKDPEKYSKNLSEDGTEFIGG